MQLENGSLPLLAPMSEIAGRLAAQVGAHLLEKPHGGRGVLMGGCTGVQPARVVVLGGGPVGGNAARTAAAMDAGCAFYTARAGDGRSSGERGGGLSTQKHRS